MALVARPINLKWFFSRDPRISCQECTERVQFGGVSRIRLRRYKRIPRVCFPAKTAFSGGPRVLPKIHGVIGFFTCAKLLQWSPLKKSLYTSGTTKSSQKYRWKCVGPARLIELAIMDPKKYHPNQGRHQKIPSTKLTYPTLGKEKNHLQRCWPGRDIVVPKGVVVVNNSLVQPDTPRKTNMSLKKGIVQLEIYLPTTDFHGTC